MDRVLSTAAGHSPCCSGAEATVASAKALRLQYPCTKVFDVLPLLDDGACKITPYGEGCPLPSTPELSTLTAHEVVDSFWPCMFETYGRRGIVAGAPLGDHAFWGSSLAALRRWVQSSR